MLSTKDNFIDGKNNLQIISRTYSGYIFERCDLKHLSHVYVFLTQLSPSIQNRRNKWEVKFWCFDNIQNASQTNQIFKSQFRSFDNKSEAEAFVNERAIILKQNLKKCVDTGGILVRTYWLHSIVTPAQLRKYFRLAKPFSFSPLSENIKQHSNIEIDPYFLGMWLGDGTSGSTNITTMDEDIIDYLQNLAKGLPGEWYWRAYIKPKSRAKTYFLCDKLGTTEKTNYENQKYRKPFAEFLQAHPRATTKDMQKIIPLKIPTLKKWRKQFKNNEIMFSQRMRNPLWAVLKKLNLLNNKHIPDICFAADRQIRLKLLAGLLDSDGHLQNNIYEITQKSVPLSNGIQRLATELGYFISKKTKLATCTNGVTEASRKGIPVERMIISGLNLDEIPCLLPRKQMQPNDKARFLPQIAFSDSFVQQKGKRKRIEWTKEQDELILKKIQTGEHKEYQWRKVMIQQNPTMFSGLKTDNIRDRYQKLQKIKE